MNQRRRVITKILLFAAVLAVLKFTSFGTNILSAVEGLLNREASEGASGGSAVVDRVSPTIMPIDFKLDYAPKGELIVEGKWPSGTVEVYAVDDRNVEILLTDYWMPNGYDFSETPGPRYPYWNVSMVSGVSDMVSVNIYEYENVKGQFHGDCLYYHENATYSCDGYYRIEQQDYGFVIKLELPKEVSWNTDSISQAYVNVGTEDPDTTDHYDFWAK